MIKAKSLLVTISDGEMLLLFFSVSTYLGLSISKHVKLALRVVGKEASIT